MSAALRYVLRRVLLLLVTMLLVSLLTYLAFELVSGDPARTMLGTEATEAQVQAHRHVLPDSSCQDPSWGTRGAD